MTDKAKDDLTRPLGLEKSAAPARSISPNLIRLSFIAALVLLVGGGWAYLREPQQPAHATAEIRRIPVSNEDLTGSVPRSAKPPDGAAAPLDKPVSTAAELEEAAGVKVIRGGQGQAPASIVIQVPQENRVRLAAAPDRRVSEKSKHGTLPRVAANGLRPADLYARPAPAEPSNRINPRIAIVIGGLGVNRHSTGEAVARLGGEFTLAFAPYGETLAAQVAKAREDGHEVMLQVPMEPLDYPTNDPGPHTLRAGAEPAENIDRLHWVMSRFSGYIGITNFLGAKFTADPASLQPILREITQRGLLILDDGSSARSVLRELANAGASGILAADLVIDATPNAAAIDKALARLEEIAKREGTAIGTATALPLSVARIAKWNAGLKQRGITLVPLSAIAAARRGS